MPIAVIANRLLTGNSLRLHNNCHDRYWTATFTERERLRKSLAMLKIDTHTSRNPQHAEHPAAAAEEFSLSTQS